MSIAALLPSSRNPIEHGFGVSCIFVAVLYYPSQKQFADYILAFMRETITKWQIHATKVLRQLQIHNSPRTFRFLE
jgi:hypothetical protein